MSSCWGCSGGPRLLWGCSHWAQRLWRMSEDFLLQGCPLMSTSLITLQGKGPHTHPVVLHKARLWRFTMFPKELQPLVSSRHDFSSLFTFQLAYFLILLFPSVTGHPTHPCQAKSVQSTDCWHSARTFPRVLLNAQGPGFICPLPATSLSFSLHSLKVSQLPSISRISQFSSAEPCFLISLSKLGHPSGLTQPKDLWRPAFLQAWSWCISYMLQPSFVP